MIGMNDYEEAVPNGGDESGLEYTDAEDAMYLDKSPSTGQAGLLLIINGKVESPSVRFFPMSLCRNYWICMRSIIRWIFQNPWNI